MRPITRPALALVALAWCSGAQAVTGQQLLRQCEALERGVSVTGDTVRLPASRDAAECWAYMAAVQDFAATVEQEGGPSIIGSCPSPETTRLDLVKAFNRYARDHRGELGDRATAALIGALQTAFPCTSGSSGPG